MPPPPPPSLSAAPVRVRAPACRTARHAAPTQTRRRPQRAPPRAAAEEPVKEEAKEEAEREAEEEAAKPGELDLDAIEPVIPLGMDGDKPMKAGVSPAEYFQGVVEEAQLVEWPSPLEALGRTVLVIAVVMGSAVVLTGVNSIFAEASKQLF